MRLVVAPELRPSSTVIKSFTEVLLDSSEDSQGRTRLERKLPADSNVNSPMVTVYVTIKDPVSGKMYTLQPQQKIARVSPLSDSDAGVIQPPVAPTPPSRLPRTGPGLPGVSESEPA